MHCEEEARRAQAALSGLYRSGALALGTLSTERACLLTELEAVEGVVATHAAAAWQHEEESERARRELNLLDGGSVAYGDAASPTGVITPSRERPSITSLLGELRTERATNADSMKRMRAELSRSYSIAEEAEERARSRVKAAEGERAAFEENVHRMLCSHRADVSELMAERAAEMTALRVRCGDLEQTVKALHRLNSSTQESFAQSERAHRETQFELAAQGSLRQQAQDSLKEEKARGERKLAREIGRTQR